MNEVTCLVVDVFHGRGTHLVALIIFSFDTHGRIEQASTVSEVCTRPSATWTCMFWRGMQMMQFEAFESNSYCSRFNFNRFYHFNLYLIAQIPNMSSIIWYSLPVLSCVCISESFIIARSCWTKWMEMRRDSMPVMPAPSRSEALSNQLALGGNSWIINNDEQWMCTTMCVT